MWLCRPIRRHTANRTRITVPSLAATQQHQIRQVVLIVRPWCALDLARPADTDVTQHHCIERQQPIRSFRSPAC